MHFMHLGKGMAVCRVILLAALLAAIGSSTGLADQLQWNPRDVCEDAVQRIGRHTLLISYCSLADADYVELWWLRGAYIAETSAEGLFEVRVLAKRLYRSPNPFSAAEFPLSREQWGSGPLRCSGWSVESVDLAYWYIHTGGDSFRCLGKALGLECLVGVETIVLPDAVLRTRASRGGMGPFAPLQSMTSLSAWRRGGHKRVP